MEEPHHDYSDVLQGIHASLRLELGQAPGTNTFSDEEASAPTTLFTEGQEQGTYTPSDIAGRVDFTEILHHQHYDALDDRSITDSYPRLDVEPESAMIQSNIQQFVGLIASIIVEDRSVSFTTQECVKGGEGASDHDFENDENAGSSFRAAHPHLSHRRTMTPAERAYSLDMLRRDYDDLFVCQCGSGRHICSRKIDPSFNSLLSMSMRSVGVPPLVYEILAWSESDAPDAFPTGVSEGLEVVQFLIKHWHMDYQNRLLEKSRDNSRGTDEEKERLLATIRRACVQRHDAGTENANVLYGKLRRMVEPFFANFVVFEEDTDYRPDVGVDLSGSNLVDFDITISAGISSTELSTDLKGKGKEKASDSTNHAFSALINIPNFIPSLKALQVTECPCTDTAPGREVRSLGNLGPSRVSTDRPSPRRTPYPTRDARALRPQDVELTQSSRIKSHSGKCSFELYPVELEFIASRCAWNLSITETSMILTLLDCPPGWMTRPLERIDDSDGAVSQYRSRREVGANVDAHVTIIPSNADIEDDPVGFVFPKTFLSPKSNFTNTDPSSPNSIPQSIAFSFPDPENGIFAQKFSDRNILHHSDGGLLFQLRVDVEPMLVYEHSSAKERLILERIKRRAEESTDGEDTATSFTEISIPSILTGEWDDVWSVTSSYDIVDPETP